MALGDPTYIQELFSAFGPVSVRRMFGGAGLYLHGVMFALIADDVLYFKIDGVNRPDYDAADMEPFRPWPDKPTTMPYCELPVDVLEDRDRLAAWAGKALAAAEKSKK